MDLVFRAATPVDIAALREVVGHEPSDEQLAMAAGDRAKAARFRDLVMGGVVVRGLSRTMVAVGGDEVVGLLQTGAEAGDKISFGLVWGLLRIFGVRHVPGFLCRDRLRSRVHIPVPKGTYHISELHVLSAGRNLGIGAALLAEAERTARSKDFRAMSLTTTTSNPARRLYERSGFEVIQTRTDPEYLACTGIAGTVLMTKQLT